MYAKTFTIVFLKQSITGKKCGMVTAENTEIIFAAMRIIMRCPDI